MQWRETYLRNRIKALDTILTNIKYGMDSFPENLALKLRKAAFADLIEFQLENFDRN